jgi:hypothetical protein
MMGSMTGSDGMLHPKTAARGLRPYDLAMSRGDGAYDFTIKATGSLRSQDAEPPPLFPKIQDIPVISDLYRMYKDSEREKKHEEMRKIGKIDTSAFPPQGCVVKGRSALCSLPLDVNVEGFKYKGDLKMGLRLNTVNNTLTESFYVNDFQRSKLTLPAETPDMCFLLKRASEESAEIQLFAIAPGPAGKRKLPMELAIRFDRVKSKENFFSANLRAECMAMGQTVATVPIGKVKIE